MRLFRTAAVVLAGIAAIGSGWMIWEWRALERFGPERPVSFLLLGLDPGRALSLLSAVATSALLAAGLSLLLRSRCPRFRLARRIVVAASALTGIAGFGFSSCALFWSGAAYTAIRGDTGGRQLIVREGGADIELFERNGAIITMVGRLGTDDFYLPFSAGQYELNSNGSAVTLSWPFFSGGPLDAELTVDDSSAERIARGDVPLFSHH